MGQAVTLHDLAVERLGDDVLVAGYLPPASDERSDGLAVASHAVPNAAGS
jgi:hypothetical protein